MAVEWKVKSEEWSQVKKKGMQERRRKWQKCERRKREKSERNWRLYEGRGRKSDRISEESRNKSWSSNTEKTKEANSLANMGVTSRTEPIVDYQERQNTSKKNHKINNVTPKTDTTVIIYNEITKEV